MNRLPIFFAALAGAGALAGFGLAAGPAPGVFSDGKSGVVSPSGQVRYVASGTTSSTMVSAVSTGTGHTLRSVSLRGLYGIPAITFNGLTGGLTPDGRVLVVGSNPYLKNSLARTSRFAVLDARTLRVRSLVKLQGLFSFDALSPDGQTLYLVEHFVQNEGFRYRVRAYDLVTHELVRHIVADPQEWADSMVGFPQARATGPGGRWVYTLYANASTPFIHALDAANRKAVCVDLPWKGSDEEFSRFGLTLSADRSHLLVGLPGGTPAFTVSTETLRVEQ